jgi:hypothetical protein
MPYVKINGHWVGTNSNTCRVPVGEGEGASARLKLKCVLQWPMTMLR